LNTLVTAIKVPAAIPAISGTNPSNSVTGVYLIAAVNAVNIKLISNPIILTCQQL